MRKILIGIITIIFITGCSNKDINLDLEKIEVELNNLEITENGQNIKLFDDNKKMDNEKLQDKYGMNTDIFEEILVETSDNLSSSSMYAIFLPKKGKESDCEKEIKDFFEKYDQAWMMGYFPDEEVLVKNRTEEKYGKYYIYIISKDNDKVIEKIKNIK